MKKKILTILMVLTMAISTSIMMADIAFAASATTSVSTSSQVTVGSQVTFTVKVSGTKLYALTHEVTYDPERLEYASSSATQVNGGGGTLKVLYEGDTAGSSSLTYKLVFKAKKTGKASVSVATQEICDSTGDDTIKSSTQSASVTIIDKAASNDANLKSLSVSSGKLDPAFSKGTTQYTVNVGNDVNQFLVTAKANNPDATVKVTGSKQLAVGENTREVTVTAPSGDSKTYTIKIIRGGSSGSSDDPGEVTKNVNITIGDDKYTVVDDLSNLSLPDGFELDVIKYDGKDMPVAKSSDGLVKIAYLKSATDGNQVAYFFDEGTGKFSETSFLKADELLSFSKGISELSPKIEEPDPGASEDPIDPGFTAKLDPQTMFLAVAIGATLFILLIVVICLQVSILRKRKKNG